LNWKYRKLARSFRKEFSTPGATQTLLQIGLEVLFSAARDVIRGGDPATM